jgi:hypothetical protein
VPFLLDAGTFAAAATLVAAMGGRFRVERPEGAAPTTLRGETAEGVRWLARHRLLRILAVAIALMNLTLSATVSISVLYAQERLGLSSSPPFTWCWPWPAARCWSGPSSPCSGSTP